MHRLVPVCPKPPCSPALGLSALGFWCNKITADAHVNSHYTGRKTEIQICQSYENVLHLKIAFGQRSLQTMRCVFTPHNDPFEQQKQNPYEIPWYCLVHRNSYMYIYIYWLLTIPYHISGESNPLYIKQPTRVSNAAHLSTVPQGEFQWLGSSRLFRLVGV